jgi:hypothetical protein
MLNSDDLGVMFGGSTPEQLEVTLKDRYAEIGTSYLNCTEYFLQ